MSDTIALVERYYHAFNEGNWQGMLDCLADEVAHDSNQGSRVVGKEAFASFLARMEHSYREQLRDVIVMASADGHRASAEYLVHGHYLADDEGLPKANGQRYVLPGGAFFDVSCGKITRVTNYYNLNDWIAQVSA